VVNSTPVSLGTRTADASGQVTFVWAVPSTFEKGTHSVTLTGASGSAVQTFTYGTLASTGPTTALDAVGSVGYVALALAGFCALAAVGVTTPQRRLATRRVRL
jgi:hypothetical protein